MPCLDNVVTLGICPDDAISTSGFKLVDAAGISLNNLANIATETYEQGVQMALEKKALTLLQVRNDFIGALQANKVVTTITDPIYNTSVFNPTKSMGTYAGERGVIIHKNGGYRGSLRKTYIKAIEVYPLSSGEGEIKIYSGNYTYSYPVTFVANQVNTFDADILDGLPFEIPQGVQYARVLIDNTTVSFASSDIACKKGCGGSMPNPCGWADGWDGKTQVRREGYGINLQFQCVCDYEQILCDLSKSFSGELIWLKWQINIFEEQYKSNRFNDWVIYNREELKETIGDLTNRYNAKWNDMMAGMLGILKVYNDSCLNCQGIKRVVNV